MATGRGNGRLLTLRTAGGRIRGYRVEWTESGKHRTRTFAPKEKHVAEDYLGEVRARTRLGSAYQAPDISLGRWIDAEWAPSKLRTLDPGTQGPLEAVIKRVPDWLRLKQLRAVTTHDIEVVLAEQAAKYAPATLAATRTTLHSIFSSAVKARRVAVNPVVGATTPKARKAGRIAARAAGNGSGLDAGTVISHDDVAAIIAKSPTWSADLITVLAYAGLRIGEAAALQAADWDSATRQLTIRRSQSKAPARLAKGGTAREDKPPKNVRSMRTITASATVAAILDRRADDAGPTDYLLTGAQGGQLSPGNWRKRQWHTARVAAGIGTEWTPHDLRHFCTSVLIAATISPVASAAYLGHSVEVYLSTYAGFFREDQSRIADALDAANPAT